MKANSNVQFIYELSSLQQGIYFYKLQEPNSSRYVIQNVYRINGVLNIEWVQKCIDALALKYDVLRTSFVLASSTGKVWQTILKNKKVEVEKISIEGLSLNEQEEEIKAIKSKDISRNFDLQNDSLLRLKIIHFSKKEHVVLWTSHHILIDGWCNGILLGDFLKFYGMMERGYSYDQVSEIAIKEKAEVGSYQDYINMIKRKSDIGAKEYWKSLLSQYDSVVSVISMKNGEDSKESVVRMKMRKLDSDAVRKLAVKLNVTQNSILETAWGLLLMKYNVCQDVVFGKVVSGRDHKINNIDKAIGLFVNTIPVRCNFQKEFKVKDAIKSTFQQSINSQEYDYYSLGSILKDSGLRPPLFNTLFVYENYYVDKEKFKTLSSIDIQEECGREETEYDLCLGINEGDTLEFELLFDNTKYDSYEMKKLLMNFNQIISCIVKHVDYSICELDICSQEEKELVLQFGHPTGQVIGMEQSIIECFEEQVRKTPDRCALVYKNERYTYDELNRRINQLANHLQELGIGNGDIVPMLSPRTSKMIIALYAILKTGAAYAMIDISFPKDRIKLILEDYDPKVIILGNGQEVTEGNFKILDLESESNYSRNTENLGSKIQRDSIAYLTSTSGTTGRPKSVMCPHGGVMSYVKAFAEYFEVNYDTVSLQHTSYSFDTIVEEVFPTHIRGGRVVLYPSEHMIDMEEAKRVIEKEQVTLISCSTLLLNELNQQNMPSCVKLYINGGDRLEYHHIRNLMNKAKIGNTFGPTEATVCFALSYVEDGQGKISVGKPIHGREVYILQKGKLCGIGVPGEICVAGTGVSLGYYRRDELTKDKFSKNPFGEGRMYHTGDLGRWLPDGSIDFLGRIDHQVKIRGYRVELKEVETVIMQEEEVNSAVVTVQETEGKTRQLVAYVVAKSKRKLDFEHIRLNLSYELPEYMIPRGFMQIDKIPTTKNGKINKKVLPKIEVSVRNEYIAAQNEVEKIISKIMCEVLEVDKVGIKDNFFELGGDSIKSIRIVNLCKKKNVEFSVKDLLHYGNIKALVQFINDRNRKLKNSGTRNILDLKGIINQLSVAEQVSDVLLEVPIEFNKLDLVMKIIFRRHPIMFSDFPNISINPKEKSIEYEQYELKHYDISDSEEAILRICQNSRNKLVQSVNRTYLINVINMQQKKYIHLCIRKEIADYSSIKKISEEFLSCVDLLYSGQDIPVIETEMKYAERIFQQSTSDLSQQEMDYWHQITRKANRQSMSCMVRKIDRREDEYQVKIVFEKDDTSNFVNFCENVLGMTVNEALRNALAVAYCNVTEQDNMAILNLDYYQDRDEEEKNAIGNFEYAYPIVFERNGNERKFTVQTFKSSLDNIPQRGEKYHLFWKKDLQVKNIPIPNIRFYSLPREEFEMSTIKFSNGKISNMLDKLSCINENEMIFRVRCMDEKLNIEIKYSNLYYNEKLMRKFIVQYQKEINKLVQECKKAKNKVYKKTVGGSLLLTRDYENFIKEINLYGHQFQGLQPLVDYEPTVSQTLFLSNKFGMSSSCFELSDINNLEEVSRALNNIIEEQSALRTIYNKKNKRFTEYKYAKKIQIPTINLEKFSYNHSELKQILTDLEKKGLKGKRSCDMGHICIIGLKDRKAIIYVFINHSLWDMPSSRVFERKLKNFLSQEKFNPKTKSYSEFTMMKLMDFSKKIKFEEVIKVAIDLKKASRHIKYDKFVNREYRENVINPNIKQNQLYMMLCLLEKLYHDLLGENCPQKIPVYVFYHGRTEENRNVIGLFQEIKLFILDFEDPNSREEIIQMLNESPELCLGLSDISKEDSKKLIPFINVIPSINATTSYGDNSGIVAMTMFEDSIKKKLTGIRRMSGPLSLNCKMMDKGIVINGLLSGNESALNDSIDETMILGCIK